MLPLLPCGGFFTPRPAADVGMSAPLLVLLTFRAQGVAGSAAGD